MSVFDDLSNLLKSWRAIAAPEKLESHIDYAEGKGDAYETCADELFSRMGEIEKLEQDAMRYRWMAAQGSCYGSWAGKAELDAHICAASSIKQSTGEGEGHD